MPFFALVRQRKSFEVSVQLAGALSIFLLASLCATTLMRCIGAKNITFVSLALATGACFILGKEDLSQEDTQNVDTGNQTASNILNSLLQFADNAIFGYLLICVSIAFLTIASLEEVLSGTENKLLRTKFIEASNMHLFVESAMMVHAIMQLAHVIGPILGGLINTLVGMTSACVIMGYFGAGALVFYLIFALFVYCTVHQENTLALRDDEDFISQQQGVGRTDVMNPGGLMTNSQYSGEQAAEYQSTNNNTR